MGRKFPKRIFTIDTIIKTLKLLQRYVHQICQDPRPQKITKWKNIHPGSCESHRAKENPISVLLFFLPKGSEKCLKPAESQSTSSPSLTTTGLRKSKRATQTITLIFPFKHSSSESGIFRVNYTKTSSNKCIFEYVIDSTQ